MVRDKVNAARSMGVLAALGLCAAGCALPLEESDAALEQEGEVAVASAPLINGQVTSANNTPFVTVTRSSSLTINQGTCSGTLVSPTQVLTAKHCLADALYSIGTISALGSVAGTDSVYLTGRKGSEISGVSTNPVNGYTYTFYSNGKWSASIIPFQAGWELGDPTASFTVPPGKNPGKIVGMEFGTDGRLYTWYNDATYSVGTESKLDYYSPPAAYTLPPDKLAWQIMGIAFDSTNHPLVLYVDNTWSWGTVSNLSAAISGQSFANSPSGWSGTTSAVQIAEITRNPNNGYIYTFYTHPLERASLSVSGNGQNRNVVSFVRHPTHDVAIVKLDGPETIQPAVGLAYLGSLATGPGHQVWCGGWGMGSATEAPTDPIKFRTANAQIVKFFDNNMMMDYVRTCDGTTLKCMTRAPGDSGSSCVIWAYGLAWVLSVHSRADGLPAMHTYDIYADGFRSWFRSQVPTSSTSGDLMFNF